MTTLDAFASAFGFDSHRDSIWVTLGKVTAVSGSTHTVMLGGSDVGTACDAYCHAAVGDVVLVIVANGRARTVSNRGGDAATRDFANALVNALGSGDGNVTDDDTLVITQNTNATEEKFYRRPISKLWPYFKGKADSAYAALTHYHGYLYNNASSSDGISNSLHRMYVSAYDNLIVQNRADSSSSWGNEKYAAITSSAPSNSSQQEANKVLATPNGSAGYPSIRTLVNGDLPVVNAAHGGTGETTLANSANALINALSTATASLSDDDTYIITENSNATEDKYYRRPISKLWDYVKSKIDSVYGIGTRESIEQSTNVALTSATGKKVASLTLAPGTWVIVGHLSFSANSSGHRAGCITTSENTVGTSSAYCGSFRIATTGGSYTTIGNCTTIVTLTASTTYYLNAWQNSGGDLNATGCMRAIRIA